MEPWGELVVVPPMDENPADEVQSARLALMSKLVGDVEMAAPELANPVPHSAAALPMKPNWV